MTWALDPAEVARFRDLVRLRTGMMVPESRTADLRRALHQVAAEWGAPDADTLHRQLLGRGHPSPPLDALVSALNVSETHFFRDAGQIRVLERHILPELIRRRRLEQRLHLRLWSAGCSTGEEAYTLAILVRRALPELAEWHVVIHATDINGRSLEHARRGVYGGWSLRGTSPVDLRSNFVRRGERFEVVPSIRSMVTFAPLNLADDVYPSPATNTQTMDLILCRNVLMYFDEVGARAVVARLRDALTEDGWLLVSTVEASLHIFDGLAHESPGTAIYRRAKPCPPAHAGPPHPAPERRAGGRRRRAPTPPPGDPAPPSRRSPDADDTSARDEALTLWRAGRPDAALQRLDVVTESRPLAARLHYLRGLILLDRDRTADALAAFRRCTYADPEFGLGHLAQAGLFTRMQLPGRARVALETAARLLAGPEPNLLWSQGDAVTAGDVHHLIAAQRQLLGQPGAPDASRG